jgi:predicted esterase
MSEQSLTTLYEYPKGNNNVSLSLIKEYPGFKHYKLQFQSAIDTEHVENGTVTSELYLPSVKSPAPLMILLHGMGDQSIYPLKLIARKLIKKGVACCIPYLTIHSKRMPLSMKQSFPSFSDKEWLLSYRVSVIDIRQIIDWAEENDGIDIRKIGLLGISFGGLVSSIVMGIDERVKTGVFIVSGGNSPKIEWLSQNRRYQKAQQVLLEDYQEKQRTYNLYLDEVFQKGYQNVTPPLPGYLLDPMTYTNSLKGRPIQMINARYDKYMPKEAVTDFWEACGKPPIKWLPSGHTSLWLWTPTIMKTIHGFLKAL